MRIYRYIKYFDMFKKKQGNNYFIIIKRLINGMIFRTSGLIS